jgi:hypothetical protein
VIITAQVAPAASVPLCPLVVQLFVWLNGAVTAKLLKFTAVGWVFVTETGTALLVLLTTVRRAILDGTMETGPGALVAAPTITLAATEGTPLALRMNSRYGPGGATLPLAGVNTFKPSPVLVTENDSRLNVWFMLKACVTEPRLIIVTCKMFAASGVTTLMIVPYGSDDGALVIAGRAPLKR